MRYKFNKDTDKELEIYSSVYLPNLNKNDSISIWDDLKEKDIYRTIKEDNKGLFFTWNRIKYYINDYYKYTKEDIVNAINNKNLPDDMFTQGIINYGVDKIVIKVPEKMYDYNYGSMKKLIDSKIKEYNSFKISDNYKINTISNDGRKENWYIINLIIFLIEGICKIEFK